MSDKEKRGEREVHVFFIGNKFAGNRFQETPCATFPFWKLCIHQIIATVEIRWVGYCLKCGKRRKSGKLNSSMTSIKNTPPCVISLALLSSTFRILPYTCHQGTIDATLSASLYSMFARFPFLGKVIENVATS